MAQIRAALVVMAQVHPAAVVVMSELREMGFALKMLLGFLLFLMLIGVIHV
jgi:cytochrome b